MFLHILSLDENISQLSNALLVIKKYEIFHNVQRKGLFGGGLLAKSFSNWLKILKTS